MERFHFKSALKIIAVVLVCFLLVYSTLHAFSKETLPPLKPFKADSPPIIDGILDDQIWLSSPIETGFKTWTPDFGLDMAEKTEVYYAYDRENLYFAFKCFDSQPEKIKTSVNSRDNIFSDDWICINLDSFNDQQSLYAFYCNPLGIQGDSRFEGGDEDYSVDVVWYSKGRIDEQGYTVELKIPFKSIRFKQAEPVEMGVIFERRISRLSEAGTYPALDPEQGANFLTQMRPLLFQDVKHYTLFEILPAVTYSRQSFNERGRLALIDDLKDLSMTVKYGLTSDLIIDTTYNPDFSQVEADAGQVDFNLRYALFYDEKRPFFLEGLEKFNFGGNHSSDPLREIVHTRTIVNPKTGLKLNGRLNEKNTVAALYAMDELPEDSEEKYAHFFIYRHKFSLSRDSFLGTTYTGRERENGFNRILGADGQIRINPSSIFGFHYFRSWTKPEKISSSDSGHTLGLHYYYTTRDWIIMLGLQDISDDFQTETGYITRTGITRFRSGVLKMFYPDSKIIKRIDPLIHSFQVKDKFSGLYETYNTFDLRFILPRNTIILAGYRYANEVFLNKKFSTSGTRFILNTQLTKQLFFNISYNYGNKIRYLAVPYQGKGNDFSASMNYLPSQKLHLDLSLIYSDFTRSSDSLKEYDYMILRSRNTFQVNKYLFFRGILEYNSFRKILTTDFLASFTYIPGTVLHIGYGSLYEKLSWVEGEYRYSDRFMEMQRGFFFKASYLWRL